MRECTRRDFLRIAAAAAAGTAATAAVTACGGPSGPAEAPPDSGRLSASPAPAGATAKPRLSVAKGADPAAITAAAVAALGGMQQFVRRGDDVVIKPNLCTGHHGPEYAATTNPDVVGQLVGLCRAAGAKSVRVMDTPFGSTADKAYEASGVKAAVEKAGGTMELMTRARFRNYRIPDGRDITQWPIYEDVLACDVLINVPIVKDHGLTRLTLGGKNLLGVVLSPGDLHGNIGQRTADLMSVCRPTLTVIDAYRVLTANGPTGGDLNDVEKLETVVASADMVAADAYAATLLGFTAADIPYVTAAAAMGLGEIDLERVDIRTERV